MDRKIKMHSKLVGLSDGGELKAIIYALMTRDLKNVPVDQLLDSITFIESTGVISENGGEIFRGDIVERYCTSATCPIKHRGVVVYDLTFAQFSIKEGNSLAPLIIGSTDGHKITSTLGITKLGSIYENPELVDKSTLDGII